MKSFFIILITLICIFNVSFTYADYRAQDFFEDASLDFISAEEIISQDEKESILESGFAISLERNSPFSVIFNDPGRLQLRNVDIHVYSRDDSGYVVSVTSILGNHGQAHYSRFYEVNDSGQIVAELSSDDLGLSDVLNNEFLDKQDFFPEEDNYPVILYIQHDGTFLAAPWTWMNPDWEHREIVKEISFCWTGMTFQKVVIRLSELKC